MSLDQLNRANVTAGEAAPAKWMLFLHGIVGSGANWRTVARRLIGAHPSWGATLVDLRMHGASQSFVGPHTVSAAASDLSGIAANGIVGHSFGGKVALEYARTHPLEHLFLIDSNPGPRPDHHGSEGTVRVLEMLAALPEAFPSRQAFLDHVQAEGHGVAIAQWLAMNLERSLEGEAYRFGLDVGALRELLDDYFARDLWSVLEEPSATRYTVILGGRSNVFDATDRERLAGIAVRNANVTMHVVPHAGHWVHAEAPDELHQLLSAALNPTA